MLSFDRSREICNFTFLENVGKSLTGGRGSPMATPAPTCL